MIFQPLVSWWFITIYATLVLGVILILIASIKKDLKNTPNTTVVKWKILRRITIILLSLLIMLGPSIQGGVSSPGISNLQVYFVIDTTPSMGSIDYINEQQRISGVKKDVTEIAALLDGASFNVITFDSQANIVLPSTSNLTALGATVDSLTPQISAYSRGSSIDKPLDVLKNNLSKMKISSPSSSRLVFYFGDGEQTSIDAPESFSDISKTISGGAVLGYGTSTGARITKNTGSPDSAKQQEFITTLDESSDQLVPAISKLDESALKKIADDLNVVYENRNSGGNLDKLLNDSKANLAIERSQKIVHYLNLYWLFTIPLVLIVFWEWQLLLPQLHQLLKRKKERLI